MTSITFVFRASTKSGRHEGSLVIRLIHRRKIKTITTDYRIYPNEWNQYENRLVILPDSPRLMYLYEIERKMSQDIFLLNQIVEGCREREVYSVSDIADNFHLRENNDTLSGFVNKLMREMMSTGQERTARAYRTVVKKIIEYNKGKDLRVEHLNSLMLRGFENDMMQKGKAPNTISFYMRNLRAIYNKAVADKLIVRKNDNPFQHVYTGVQKTRKRALKREELIQIYELDIFDRKIQENADNKELHMAMQMFFFCFHARGMSFVDMAYLRKDNIKKGIISYYRKKTGQLIEVKVSKAMQKIIDYFAPQVKGSEYLFPVIKDKTKSARLQYESGLRVQNKRLKKIAGLAKITKTVSTHVARHSWATVAKHENLPIWVISEGLGHSNEKTTYTYLASFERSVIDKASEQISIALNRRRIHNRTLKL